MKAFSSWKHRARALSVVFLTVLVSCDEEVTIDYSPSPQVARVDALRVNLGAQQMTVFKDGRVTLGPLVLIRPGATITTTLLDESGQPIPPAEATDIKVDMGRLSGGTNTTGLNFTRTSDFGGSLAATTAGTTNFTFSLFDKAKRRIAFGPYTVAIVVR